MASLEKRDDKKKISSRANKRSTVQKHDPKPGSSGSKPSKSLITNFLKVLSKKQIDQNEFHLNATPHSKKKDVENGTLRSPNKLACKRKKAFPRPRGSYRLRSLDSGRVLRSTNTTKCNSVLIPVSTPKNLVPRPKKRGKKSVKKSDQDELSRIKKHIRYMLKRMNYEQSLIDAYSGEGWKGQSAEKIRPEKELGRAKSEILRCKLKVREIFQHLDSLLAEGRLQESLFDTDGIDSENIFCGKCGSKEVSTENDIILCDGVCERGFHQNCLNPPLLSEDIPSGDEGWLCPECDCKLESIDLLNEFLEKDISFEDSWERIFPEAAAFANGNGQYNGLNLPSDDFEDDGYNPAQRVGVNEQVELSVCEESDSSSSSCDSTSSDENTGQSAQATVELSTDDSEDEDYDPDAIIPDKEIQKTNCSSDESDFTSDSDAFCTELRKNSLVGTASASSPPTLEFFKDSVRENLKDQDMRLDDSELLSPMLEVEKQESGLRSSNKRDRERLDYKKLYDEAYGKSSSDSSDDEDWCEKITPKKLMKIDDDEEIDEDSIYTVAKTTQKLKKGISSISASEKEHVPRESHSSSYSSTRRTKYGIANKKKLYDAFQENQYPTKEKKECLAQELGMTFQQVTKWFGNARHSSTAASTPPKPTDSIRTAEKPYKKKLKEAFQENQYPSKGKKEELAQELGMTSRQVSRWFESARRNFLVSAKKSSVPLTSCSNKAQVPNSDMLNMGAADMTPGEFALDKATITTSTSNSSPGHLKDRIILTDTSTPEGCTSYRKPKKRLDLESSGIPTTDKNASNEMGKKSPVATSPKSESKVKGEEDDRQKAIAKELRRMKAGR
ncbi:Homeobox protein HOX1A [Platanthera zijinensis]|uniref:Homeobox protein HOX1A n=1 Tax=Platanthera zijinensis TaxID=2320716 RepID=A0AAP0AX61_9ASPA